MVAQRKKEYKKSEPGATQKESVNPDSDPPEVSSEKDEVASQADDPPRLEPRRETGIVRPHLARAPDGRTVIVRPSTAVFPNRVRDKIRIEATLRLPETGDARTEFYSRGGNQLFAVGYDRVVYGDHGPYIEFGEKHVRWHSFPIFKVKPAWSYFDEWYTLDGTLMLYAQKRLVTDKPNPPAGQWAVHNHRPEGYADYRVGKYYVPCEVDEINAVIRFNMQPSSWSRHSRPNLASNGRSFDNDKVDAGNGGSRSDLTSKKGRRWHDQASHGGSGARNGYPAKGSVVSKGNGKAAHKGKNGSAGAGGKS